MSFKYKLPGENLQVMECETESNALVIIGANGSGKSKLTNSGTILKGGS